MNLISYCISYLAKKVSLEEKTVKWACIGILALIVSSIGICIGNIATYTEYVGENRFLKQRGYETIYKNNWLIAPSVFLMWGGVIALCPAFIKLSLRLIKSIWKLIKLMIYEVIYEGRRAVEDAKKKKRK